MKRSKFTEQQIAFALKQAELPPGGRGVPEARHQRCDVLQLEEENTRREKLVADLSLDKAMLQDVLSKKL